MGSASHILNKIWRYVQYLPSTEYTLSKSPFPSLEIESLGSEQTNGHNFNKTPQQTSSKLRSKIIEYKRKLRSNVNLILPKNNYFITSVILPYLIDKHIDQALTTHIENKFLLEKNTIVTIPISKKNVDDKIIVKAIVIEKSFLTDLEKLAKDNNFNICAYNIQEDEISASIISNKQKLNNIIWLGGTLLFPFISLVIIFLSTFVLNNISINPQLNYEQQRSIKLEENLKQLSADHNSELNSELSNEALKISQNVRRAILIQRLSETLPNSTTLLALRMQENNITIEGYSKSAHDVLASLARQKWARNANFTSATVIDEKEDIQNFNIHFVYLPHEISQ